MAIPRWKFTDTAPTPKPDPDINPQIPQWKFNQNIPKRSQKKVKKVEGVGGLTPWWSFWEQSTPEQKISASLETPAFGGTGGVVRGAVKTGLAVGAGALIASIFGGTDQTQSGEQTTDVIPTQTTPQEQWMGAWQDLTARVTSLESQDATQSVGPINPATDYGSTTITGGGGDLWYQGPTTITATTTGISQEAFSGVLNYLAQMQSQQAVPTQTVSVVPTQTFEQEATSSSSWLMLLAIGAIALSFLSGRKKKK